MAFGGRIVYISFIKYSCNIPRLPRQTERQRNRDYFTLRNNLIIKHESWNHTYRIIIPIFIALFVSGSHETFITFILNVIAEICASSKTWPKYGLGNVKKIRKNISNNSKKNTVNLTRYTKTVVQQTLLRIVWKRQNKTFDYR